MTQTYEVATFLYASFTGAQVQNTGPGWEDIPSLSLPFDEIIEGSYLVTLTVPDIWSDTENCGAQLRIIMRTSNGNTPLGVGFFWSGAANQRVPFSLTVLAPISPVAGGTQIVAQWQTDQGGNAYIGLLGLSTLTALGSP